MTKAERVAELQAQKVVLAKKAKNALNMYAEGMGKYGTFKAAKKELDDCHDKIREIEDGK